MTHQPSIIWVYDGSLKKALDSVTRISTAQELVSLGWRVRLIASGFPNVNTDTGIELIQIRRPDIYILGLLSYQFNIFKWLLKNASRNDIVFCNPPNIILMLALKLTRFWNKQGPKIVMDIRDVPSLKAGFRFILHWAYSYFAIILGHLIADYETAITPMMVKVLKFPPQKVLCTWPSGVTLQRFTHSREQRDWDLASKPIELIYIGQIFFESSLVELVEGFLLAIDEGVDARLKFIGSGPDMEQLEQLVQQKGRGMISVLKPVPVEQVADILSQAHIGISPIPNKTKYRMSSPLKLLEYMASGMPVIATKIECHTEVSQYTDFIFWVYEDSPEGFKNAIIEAWQKRMNLKNLGEKAFTASQNWTWEQSARKLSDGLLKVQIS